MTIRRADGREISLEDLSVDDDLQALRYVQRRTGGVGLRPGPTRRQGFRHGAVDYLVEPYSQVEVAARIRATPRRRETPEPTQSYVLGDLTIDYAERIVSLGGRSEQLTDIEYRALA